MNNQNQHDEEMNRPLIEAVNQDGPAQSPSTAKIPSFVSGLLKRFHSTADQNNDNF